MVNARDYQIEHTSVPLFDTQGATRWKMRARFGGKSVLKSIKDCVFGFTY